MTNSPRAHLLSIATAVPPYILDTTDVTVQAAKIFARFGALFEKMLPVFSNTGIDRRYSVCPTEWFHEPHGWPDRTDKFLEGAKALFKDAAQKALDGANTKASEIDIIVTISSTGIATPSIEAHVMHEMGFREDVHRVPVFGLGCAGGLSGMALAAQLAVAMPGRKVLLVVIELCTLAFRPDEMTKSNIIASALFGDGAAAAVLCADGDAGHGAIEHSGQHCWPGTIDVMGWRVDPEGFGAIFSRSIPDLASRDLRPAADLFMARHKLTMADVDAFSFHPGGAKVIQALEPAFELDDGRLVNERRILAGFGNMSAPTVLFVLEECLKTPTKGRRFLCALGPGFTGSFMTMVH
jgi:alkylresorcinol/alkylpyrone synthase